MKKHPDILEFSGEHRWLSNFWPSDVTAEGVHYPTVEHAYQASKTLPEYRKKLRGLTAGQAKRASRTLPIRPDWESVKLETMRGLIAQKFRRGTELAEFLLDTGLCLIVEGNSWGDRYWGVCGGEGDNNLGRLIMEQRDLLRSLERSPFSTEGQP